MSILLHIGTPKAGSTTLQYFLEANLQPLAARGFRVPRSASRYSQRQLMLYALDDDRKDPLRLTKGHVTVERIRHFRGVFRERFLGELAGWPRDDTVLLTCERLSRLERGAEVERLAALLAETGRPVRILAYLRRQDAMVVSSYVQGVRGGSTAPFDATSPAGTGQLDYRAMLTRWAAVFGDAAVRARPLERSQLVQGDLVADYLGCAGAGPRAGLAEVPLMNPSMDAHCTEFLRQLNAWLPRFAADATNPRLDKSQRTNPLRAPLLQMLEGLSRGSPIRMSAADARAINERHAAGNAEVARRWAGRPDGVLFQEQPGGAEAVPPSLPPEALERLRQGLLDAIAQAAAAPGADASALQAMRAVVVEACAGMRTTPA